MKRPREIERYTEVFERLCDIALPPHESVELIKETAAQHKSASMLRAQNAGTLVDG